MNFIDRGLNWFEERREGHCVEPVVVTQNSITRTVLASVIEPQQATVKAGISSKTDTFLILVKRKFMLGIKPKAGTKFTRTDGSVYELVLSKLRVDDYNDPNRLTLVLPAKEITNSATN